LPSSNKIMLDSGRLYTLVSVRIEEATYDEDDNDTCYKIKAVGSSPIFFAGDDGSSTSVRIYVDGPQTKHVDDIIYFYLGLP